MDRSLDMVLATCGCRIFMATEAVGTDGGGSWRMAGAITPEGRLRCRRGPRYDGGIRFCLRVAR